MMGYVTLIVSIALSMQKNGCIKDKPMQLNVVLAWMKILKTKSCMQELKEFGGLQSIFKP
jgi:hypothetical protein